ncbi:N-acetyltransferase [Bacillus aerolatus]|uniref:N-acetyltransferase n=1 Tax=Bacillus aerolatus TaxID=2653354 RepID=A0A6I1FB14_9BACI|nr:N-acetyltransferase [Bacillus aerolatus]KAB7704245.1 N-acetyltransferase [Bacillus aerolatus]
MLSLFFKEASPFLYANEEIVLPRSVLSIYQHLQCMYVVKDKEQVVGVAGLHMLGKDLAEVRSLVVDPKYHHKGIGRMLVNHIIMESSKLGVERLISLTYQVDFFIKCGFNIVEKETLPEKVWIDCMNCPKFNRCDEVAMIKYLTEK